MAKDDGVMVRSTTGRGIPRADGGLSLNLSAASTACYLRLSASPPSSIDFIGLGGRLEQCLAVNPTDCSKLGQLREAASMCRP